MSGILYNGPIGLVQSGCSVVIQGLQIDLHSDVPVYRQIAEWVHAAATDGRLESGRRLPPTRDLARQLGVNRNTVVSAYEYMASRGWVNSHTGKGTFVAPVSVTDPAATPIHEGNGEMQLIIDEGANDQQRAALESIMTGGDTDEMATVWFVYSKMAPNKHPTLYEKISYESDIENRQANGSANGIFDVSVKPIPHIVHGKPHRARINVPLGFEFDVAEAACGSTTTTGGAIALAKNNDTHAHLAKLNFTGHGAIH